MIDYPIQLLDRIGDTEYVHYTTKLEETGAQQKTRSPCDEHQTSPYG